MADEERWVGIPIFNLIERGPCRVPEKKEEVVRSLKAHGAMAKGTFDKVRDRRMWREEKGVKRVGLWSQIARLFTRKKRTKQEKSQERSLIAAESQDHFAPSKEKSSMQPSCIPLEPPHIQHYLNPRPVTTEPTSFSASHPFRNFVVTQ